MSEVRVVLVSLKGLKVDDKQSPSIRLSDLCIVVVMVVLPQAVQMQILAI